MSTFCGRREELERIEHHLANDAVYVFYGVAGIGKTELAYRAAEMARALPALVGARSVLLEVRPGATATRVLIQLLDALGCEREPRVGHRTERDYHGRMLVSIAAALERAPHLVLIDDVHHLPQEELSAALAFLGRRVRASRVFVTSRQHISFSEDAPMPVITSLGPLDEPSAAELLERLVARLQVTSPDASLVYRTTRGSPFYIRRAVARRGEGADALGASLSQLTPLARELLLIAAVTQRPLAVASVARDAERAAAMTELEDRFLVDTGRGTAAVHDLVRDALMREASPAEIQAAHLDAAEACTRRIAAWGAPPVLDLLDTVHHYIAAARCGEAWALVERWFATLAASGEDHLLLEPLRALGEALPQHRVAIQLLVARCLVRASLIDEAGAALAVLDEADLGDARARYYHFAAEVAQRRGELMRAEELLGIGLASDPTESERFHLRLQLAVIAGIRMEGDRARQILDDAVADLDNPTSRQRGRCGWVKTFVWLVDERYEFAAAEAKETREALRGKGHDDLVNRLAMFETLACIESDDMAGAREAARFIDDAGLRQPVAELYRHIVAYADGEVKRARKVLAKLYVYLRDSGDTINAFVGAYYASAAAAALGQLNDARKMAEEAADIARVAGIVGFVARALAQQALLAAESIQSSHAHQLAAEALACRPIGPHARATAHCAIAHACTIEGDVARALEHVGLARDAVSGPGLTSARILIDVEHAGVILVGGNLQRAVELAEPAVVHYRHRSREYEAARAQLVLAAAYVARGRRTDLVFAEETVAAARESGDRSGLVGVQVGCAILSAALARHAHRDRKATELLTEALRVLGPDRGTLYANALIAAIEGGVAAGAVPGAIALLGHLGLVDHVGCYIVDQHGRRAATDKDVERERTSRALFVDEVHSELYANSGADRIAGRPIMCALLSQLIQAGGEPVDPATLYKQVWGEAEYHPLQHRNRLYVAINRLRNSMGKLFGERAVVERAGGGWRLATGLDASAAIPFRKPD